MAETEEVVDEKAARIARVEQVLGWRVVKMGTEHQYSSGIQVQKLTNGKVTNVRPGDKLDWRMWLLLTTPEPEWEVALKEAGME